MLTLSESNFLLSRIYPNYPELTPQNPVPSPETWHQELGDFLCESLARTNA